MPRWPAHQCSPVGWAARKWPPGEDILNRAGIPTFRFPDTAARVFHDMWRYSLNLPGLYETPAYPDHSEQIDAARARSVIEAARGQGRELLTEESKQVLAAY